MSDCAPLDANVIPTRDPLDGILNVCPVKPDVFVGDAGARNHIGTVFGGRLVAQALVAAGHTVADMPVTSLHAYFLASGRLGLPLEYRVQRLRDSRRFANRQVTAFQDGQAIFTLMCEFHMPEDGFAHQAVPMPDVPPPAEVESIQDFVRRNADHLEKAALDNFSGPLPVELRPVAPEAYFMRRAEPVRNLWIRRSDAAHIDDPRLHQCLLAFASDYWLAGTAAIPHVFPTNSEDFLISSLDHAMWFHRPVRCDEWLLHHTTGPTASDGLGLAQGRIFDREGRLVATTAQESLLRRLKD